MAASTQNRVSLFSITALVIGSTIDAGTSGLPFTIAAGPFGATVDHRREASR